MFHHLQFPDQLLNANGTEINNFHNSIAMGAEIGCIVDPQQQKSLQSSNEAIKELEMNQESENQNAESIDEESPFSKYDIQFLKTSFRASEVKKKISLLILGEDKSNKQSQLILPLIEDDSKAIWFEAWTNQILKKNTEELDNKTSFSLAIKKYFEYMSQGLTKYENLKISEESFLKIRKEPINSYYVLEKKIGEGSFGRIYRGKCRNSGQFRAVKILKQKIMNAKDQELFLAEMNLLKKLDHINIIKLYDTFYYNCFYYVVTEYCDGGSLLSCMQTKPLKSQEEVAFILKQVLSALSYMHKKKIAHRDLKLQNIVLVQKVTTDYMTAEIKLIDFGLSEQFQKPFRNLCGFVGTPSYMAPQVIKGYYSFKSDIWSCGIMLCLMVVGFNPFKKPTLQQTKKSILHDELNFKTSSWGKVSNSVKNLIQSMLQKKPEDRITIEQILNHEWFSGIVSHLPKRVTKKTALVIDNFTNYSRANNFICFVKNFMISRKLTQAQRQQMALIFQKIDSNCSGVIEKQELIQLYELVTGISNEHAQLLIEKIDQNKSGRIDFQQFLLVMTNDEIMSNRECLKEAFDYFDLDKTGYIEKKQMLECLQGCDEADIISIILQIDCNGDGKISRSEFSRYMLSLNL